jgi:hypothetical protein
MYADVLTDAMRGWNDDLTGDALLGYVLACRAALSTRDLAGGGSARASLITQIAYDRALINLAASNGIEASPRNFRNPQEERHRLEMALAETGIVLEGPSTPGL